MNKIFHILLTAFMICTTCFSQSSKIKLVRIQKDTGKPYTAWRIQNNTIYLLSTYDNIILRFDRNGTPLKPVKIDSRTTFEFQDFLLSDSDFYLLEKTMNSIMIIDQKGVIKKQTSLYNLNASSIHEVNGDILIESSSGMAVFNRNLEFRYFVPVITACPFVSDDKVPFMNQIGEGTAALDIFLMDMNNNLIEQADSYKAPEKMLIYGAKTFSSATGNFYLHLDLGIDGKLMKSALLKLDGNAKILTRKLIDPNISFELDLPREYLLSDDGVIYSFSTDDSFFVLNKL